jgi:hypothetical protein
LTAAERARLESVHARLREAVAAYERFLGGSLAAGETVPLHGAREVAEAQAAIESAESELWQLREELLGWHRPAWAPRATLVSDWFSEEDSVYDARTDS